MSKELAKSPKSEAVRTNLVKKFRKQIKNNTYEIKSGEIAGRMAKELFSTTAVVRSSIKP